MIDDRGWDSAYDPSLGDVWEDKRGNRVRVIQTAKPGKPTIFFVRTDGTRAPEARTVRGFTRTFKFIRPGTL